MGPSSCSQELRWRSILRLRFTTAAIHGLPLLLVRRTLHSWVQYFSTESVWLTFVFIAF